MMVFQIIALQNMRLQNIQNIFDKGFGGAEICKQSIKKNSVFRALFYTN